MTGVIATIPRNQFFDQLGKPLAGGKLYTYLAGTTTPAATYQDQALTIKNENGIPLDAIGSCSIWLAPEKNYKFVLKDKRGVTVPGWPVDNISGAATPVSLEPTLAPYLKTSRLAESDGTDLIVGTLNAPGAMRRSQRAKNSDSVSVKDFGAKGDGVADDTAAIQAAIDYASIYERGCCVFFPRGKYRITSTITLAYNKVGMAGDGAVIITANPPTDAYPWFYITHSDDVVFPSYSTLSISGLRIQSTTPLRGFAFKVEGKGIDKFAAHVEFKRLDIQGFYAAWEYGDYAFAPIISKCAVSGCNQLLRSKGATAAGAHYVIEKTLITECGNKELKTPIFDLGAVQTYKVLACDIEAVKSTIFASQGADLYVSHTHYEVDVGKVGMPLFVVDNPDYGHIVHSFCTGFWWMSPAADVPFWTSANRMATFVITDSRVVVDIPKPGEEVASQGFLANHVHPFLGNKAISLRSPLNPASGQALLLSAPNNNSFTNWAFARAFTEDFTEGGVGDPLSIVTGGAPVGTGNGLVIPRSRFAASGLFAVPDGAQMAMIAFWGKTTFFSPPSQVSLEIRLYNANMVQTYVFVENITNGTLNKWDRFQIGTLRNLSDKTNKFVRLTFSCPDGGAYELRFPFIDFA